jgi:hypothetical protein
VGSVIEQHAASEAANPGLTPGPPTTRQLSLNFSPVEMVGLHEHVLAFDTSKRGVISEEI